MATTRTRLITFACLSLIVLAGLASPALAQVAGSSYVAERGRATNYANNYLNAAEITTATGDMFNFAFGGSSVSVDLDAYAASGVSLNVLVDEINTAWKNTIGYTDVVASSYFDTGTEQWRLMLTDPAGGGAFSVTNTDSINPLDSSNDFSAYAPPPAGHATTPRTIGQTTTAPYTFDFIGAPRITAHTRYLVQVGFNGSMATIDLSAYDASGISLDLLVEEINAGWQGMGGAHENETIASAVLFDRWARWQLELTDPVGDGSTFAIGTSLDMISPMDSLNDFFAVPASPPSTPPDPSAFVGMSHLSARGRATSYAPNYITAGEIVAVTEDTISFGWAWEPTVPVDLSAYAASGISLDMLVDEINAAWQANGGAQTTQLVARAYYDEPHAQWRLMLTDPWDGYGGPFQVDNVNAISVFDEAYDFDAFSLPAPQHSTMAQRYAVTRTTSYAYPYISASDITAATGDEFDFIFGYGGDQVTIDLGAYASAGISLDLLVQEINQAWNALPGPGDEVVASAYFDESTGLWQLQLTDPSGDGSDFIVVDGGSAIPGFNTADDFSPTYVPEPLTLSLLAMGGGMLLRRRK